MFDSEVRSFLINAHKYIDYGAKGTFRGDEILIKEAEKGNDPCKICGKKDCATVLCLPWYIRYRRRWRNIRRCAGIGE